MTFDKWIDNKGVLINSDIIGLMRTVWNDAVKDEREACAKACEQNICASQGFAGATCCILPRGHEGQHSYGVPQRKSVAQCASEIRARGDK